MRTRRSWPPPGTTNCVCPRRRAREEPDVVLPQVIVETLDVPDGVYDRVVELRHGGAREELREGAAAGVVRAGPEDLEEEAAVVGETGKRECADALDRGLALVALGRRAELVGDVIRGHGGILVESWWLRVES